MDPNAIDAPGDVRAQNETEDPIEPAIPDWIGEVVQSPLVRRAAEAVQAIASFTRAPRRFSEDWANGRGPHINPLLLMITSISATIPIVHLTDRYTSTSPPTLVGGIIANVTPFAYYAALGVIAHVVLVAFGARAPVRGSLGVSLFTGAGPGVLLTMGLRAMGMAFYARYGAWQLRAVGGVPATVGLVALVILLIGLLAMLTLALAGVNGVSIGKAAIAVLLAVVVCGVCLEPFDDYGNFAHVVVRVHHGPDGWSFSGDVRT